MATSTSTSLIINGIDFNKRCDLEKIQLKLRIDRRQREREEQKRQDEFFEMIEWTNKLIYGMHGLPLCVNF